MFTFTSDTLYKVPRSFRFLVVVVLVAIARRENQLGRARAGECGGFWWRSAGNEAGTLRGGW